MNEAGWDQHQELCSSSPQLRAVLLSISEPPIYLECPFKHGDRTHPQSFRGPGWALELVFLTSSQGTGMLLGWGPHLENY